MSKPKKTFAERLEALGHKDYRSYLNSIHWKRFRKLIIERDKVCLCCGGEPEQVHHVRYRNFGCERPEDAVTLCGSCHEKIHDAHRLRGISLGHFGQAAAVVREANGFLAPDQPQRSLPRKKKKKKPKRNKSLPYIEPLPAVQSSPVEELPLFSKRFVIASSLKGGKTLDRIQMELRCSREHLDRVACWLSKQALASVTPDRPRCPTGPARRPKGLRRFLDKHRP